MPVDPEILRRNPKSSLLSLLRPAPRPEKRRRDADAAAERTWQRAGLEIPDVHVEGRRIPVEGFPDVDVRVHRPHHSTSLLPVFVTFFGGAFRQGSNDYAVNRWMHATRCREADIVVIAVDYALAPEHRHPTQVEQGLAVLDWLREHGPEVGADPDRIAVGGQSSGANIAAAVAQSNLDREVHPLLLQLLEVPALDLTGGHADRRVLRELHIPQFLLRLDRRSITRDYLPPGTSAADPRVSPLLREDLRGLPAAVILASQYDPLRGDAAAYHARLREVDVPSSTVISLGLAHDSSALVGSLAAADFWQGAVIAALRELHTAVPRGN